MNRILKVAQREYIETVKTRTFLIGILFTFVLMGLTFLVSIKLQEKSRSGALPDRHIVALNSSPGISEQLETVFSGYNASHPQRKLLFEQEIVRDQTIESRTENLKRSVLDGKIDGYVIIDGNVIEGDGGVRFYCVKVTDFELFSNVQRLVNDAVFNSRLRLNNLSPELIGKLRRWVPVEQINLRAKTEKKQNEFVALMMPFFFMFLMFMGIVTTSQGLLMSVIEEKSSRVIEILLASVSSFQLMTGKILGQSGVGLTLVSIYAVTAFVTAHIRGLNIMMSPGIFLYFILFYILGFLLVSSILAAIGSACNDIKEAQSLMGPVTITLIVPMVAWFYIVQRPEGMLAVVLSFIPITTPMVMILRMAVRPDLPMIQIIGSIALLALSVPAVMWAASKVFRTGILMYGKQPSIKELFRWVRSE
ncbi:ABC transporter permease [bacterium]|nr:ABC transporter permease [bacterium]